MFTRFSTVAGGAGSVDTPRDVRGFAVKFYTQEGNWDLVGNNIPVFFIQDAIKFPDLVHAVKMEPDRGFPQSATAHDTFWDFISLTPESMHMIMWAMSRPHHPALAAHDRRLRRPQLPPGQRRGQIDLRQVPLAARAGPAVDGLGRGGEDRRRRPDFHRRDLFEAIEAGAFPEWELAVQLFTEEQADALPVRPPRRHQADPRGAGAADGDRPHGARPLARQLLRRDRAGRLLPANIVPGIDFTNDPLLQGRLFSYLDTQLSRLGGPISTRSRSTRPSARSPTSSATATCRCRVPRAASTTSRARSHADLAARDAGAASAASPSRSSERASARARIRAETFADHYSQARLFYRSQTAPEQAHIASALVFELSKVETAHVREAMVGHLRHIDADLAQRVADGLGMEALPPRAGGRRRRCIDMPPSPALQIIGKMKDTLEGRAVGILVADGSDGAARRGAAQGRVEAPARRVKIVAPKVGGATLADGERAARRRPARRHAVGGVRCGRGGAVGRRRRAPCRRRRAAIDFVRDAFGHLKAIAVDDGRPGPAAEAPAWRPTPAWSAPMTAGRLHRRRQDAAVEPGAGGAHARLRRGLGCDNRSTGQRGPQRE